MKNSNVHATLSDLHRLLSTHTSEDFASASEYSGLTPSLREALQALSREARGASVLKESRDSSSNAASNPVRKVERSLDATSGLSQKAQLVSMLQEQPRFPSTQSILQFANEFGLKIEPRDKEGRERLAGRVADAVLQQTVQRQSQIVNRLSGGAQSATQGWINAVKGARS